MEREGGRKRGLVSATSGKKQSRRPGTAILHTAPSILYTILYNVYSILYNLYSILHSILYVM